MLSVEFPCDYKKVQDTYEKVLAMGLWNIGCFNQKRYLAPDKSKYLELTYKGEIRFGPGFFTAAVRDSQTKRCLVNFRRRIFGMPGLVGKNFYLYAMNPWSPDSQSLTMVEWKWKAPEVYLTTLKLFSVPDKKSVILDRCEDGMIADSMWAPDGKQLLYKCGYGMSLWKMYDLPSQKSLLVKCCLESGSGHYYFSKSGSYIVVVEEVEKSIKLYQTDSLTRMYNHTPSLEQVIQGWVEVRRGKFCLRKVPKLKPNVPADLPSIKEKKTSYVVADLSLETYLLGKRRIHCSIYNPWEDVLFVSGDFVPRDSPDRIDWIARQDWIAKQEWVAVKIEGEK